MAKQSERFLERHLWRSLWKREKSKEAMLKVSAKSSRAMGTEGPMTDASKRQRDEQSEWSFPPVSPVSPSSEELTAEIVFPCGVSSLEKRGKVIITTGA